MRKLLLYFVLTCSLVTSMFFFAGCSAAKISNTTSSNKTNDTPAKKEPSKTLLAKEDIKIAQQTPDGLISFIAKIEYDLFKSNFSEDAIKNLYLLQTQGMVNPTKTKEEDFIVKTKSGWEEEKNNYGKLLEARYTTLKDMVKTDDNNMSGSVEIYFDNYILKKGYRLLKKQDGLWYISQIQNLK